jgi:hypothetical protein
MNAVLETKLPLDGFPNGFQPDPDYPARYLVTADRRYAIIFGNLRDGDSAAWLFPDEYLPARIVERGYVRSERNAGGDWTVYVADADTIGAVAVTVMALGGAR